MQRPQRRCKGVAFCFTVVRGPITLLFLGSLLGVPSGRAQDVWPVDSLLTTWPVAQRMVEPRHRPKPPRTVEEDEVYPTLKHSAPELPVFVDSTVHHMVELFSGKRRDAFRAVMGMAALHQPMVEEELDRQELPHELKYLPFALSAMNPLAAGTTGEAGLWMLPWHVALREGLRVDGRVDERYDVARSTRAALQHLAWLRQEWGDWPTAVIAYACGPAELRKAKAKAGQEASPRELALHMPPRQAAALQRLMAFTFLSERAERLDLQALPIRYAEPMDTLRFDSTLRIDALCRVVGIRPARFRAQNPTIVGPTLEGGSPFVLVRTDAERFRDLAFVVLEAQSTKPRAPAASTAEPPAVERLEDGREAILYRVTLDDCIQCIAERFQLSTADIRQWNELADDQLEVGNTLLLFVRPEIRKAYEAEVPMLAADTLARPLPRDTVRTAPVKEPSHTWYTVRAGDSLYGIAKRHPGVSADDLMRLNGIGAGIRPGQRIKIPAR